MGSKKWFGLILLAAVSLLVLAACGGGAQEAAPAEETGAEAPAGESEAGGEEAAGAMTESHVVVDDQDASGGTVTVGDIYSAEGAGWIVIHADQDGAPGPVAGHAAVAQGQNDDVSVEIDLSKATPTLYAMLHTDAGAAGEYEFPGPDGPVMDAEGNVITPPFAVTLPDGVYVSDQPVADGSVTIDRVVYSGAGWLVIHADNNGAPGPVLGYAPVSAGVNDAVQVAIDEAGVTDTLYAMLHTDAGAAGEYEFPGPDGPVMDAQGNVITPPFSVAGASAASAGEAAISIVDSSFEGGNITVAAGTAVVWTDAGSRPHTVTSDDGLFDSDTLSMGDTFSFTFDTPGTYAYYCKIHGGPGGAGMSGTITVTG